MIRLKITLASVFIFAFIFSSYSAINATSNPATVGCADIFTEQLSGTAYLWNFGPFSYPATGTGQAAPTAFLTPGSHTVRVAITTGGGVINDSLTINVQASDNNVTLTASTNQICPEATVIYTATPATYQKYAFFIDDTLRQFSSANADTVELVGGDSVQVFGFDGTCFTNGSAFVHVNFNPAPPVLSSSISNDTICSGDLVVFTALPNTDDIYEFANGGSVEQQTASNTWSTTQLGQGNEVSVRAQKNGCTSVASNYIFTFVKPRPEVTDTASTTGICSGQPITIAADPTGLTNYNFFVNSSSVQNTANNTYTSSSFANNDTITVIGTLNGCSSDSIKPIIIKVSPSPSVTLAANPTSDTICQGSPITFTASPSTYSDYLFYVGNTLVQDDSSNIYTTTTLTNGSVVSVVASNNGCEGSHVGNFAVTVLPGALPTISFNPVACYGTSDTVAVSTGGSSGYTYTWSNGATTSSIIITNQISGSVAASEPFSVTVTNTGSSSCGAIFTDTILEDLEISSTDILTLHICNNPATGDLKIVGTGGLGFLTYSVVGIGSDTSGSFPGLLSGSHTFNIVDSLGCSRYPGPGSETIPQSITSDSFTVTTLPVTCNGFDNGEIIITPVNAGDVVFIYQVDGGQFLFTDTFTGIAAGVHNIVVKSFLYQECPVDLTDTVGQLASYSVSVNPDTVFTSPGLKDTATVTTSFPNPVYAWSPVAGLSCDTCNAPTITADSTNTVYYVKVSSSADSGCYAIDSVIVIVVPPVLPDSFLMPTAFTPNGDGRNDNFGPITSMNYTNPTIKTFRIYNRWGQLVHNANAYWDGKFDGKEQPVGTYIYYIEVQYANPNNTSTMLTFKKEGSVTLLR